MSQTVLLCFQSQWKIQYMIKGMLKYQSERTDYSNFNNNGLVSPLLPALY